jgi:CheY-like chemotaxis protein
MPRVRLIHWKAGEAEPCMEKLRKAGFTVEYDEKPDYSHMREWRKSPPDAFVIDLTRLPSHGREVATALRNYRDTRSVPLLFLDGEKEKVERARQTLPDAEFTTSSALIADVKRAIRNGSRPDAPPVRPPAMMDRYGSRSVAEKLGIKPNQKIALLDPPAHLEALIEGLPEGVEWVEADDGRPEMGLYFVLEPGGVRSAFGLAKRQKNLKKLWVARKKPIAKARANAPGMVSDQLVRETGIELGFVDYKVCAISDVWSGLLFARKKPDRP